jgi:DNA repair exonuclease SbcCD ATPase subunit
VSAHDQHTGAQRGHQASIIERLDVNEKFVGLNAEKHGDGLAVADSTLETLQSRLAMVEKYGPVLDEIRRSHGSLAKEKEMLSLTHSSLQDRLESTEQAITESLDKFWSPLQTLNSAHDKHGSAMSKHAKDLEGLKAKKQAHFADMLGRVGTLEQMHGDAAGKHAQDFSQLHGTLHSVLERLSGVEKHGQHIGDLRTVHDELAQKNVELELNQAMISERIADLEQLIGDTANKHAKELKALHDPHNKHANEVETLKQAHVADMLGRVGTVEQMYGDVAGKHTREFSQLHGKLHSVFGAPVLCREAWTTFRRPSESSC